MIPGIRQWYNQQFSVEKYQAYISSLENIFPAQLDFRVAETPVFIPADFRDKMLSACEAIVDVVTSAGYHRQSEKAIPANFRVPHEDRRPHCIAFDFAICKNEQGEYEPQLIEMQGFPSLFAWQVLLADTHRKIFEWPTGFSPYLNGYNRESYIELLKKVIVGNAATENVILLEIHPEKQKTRVDFYATEHLLGIKTVSLTDVVLERRQLFYFHGGRKIQIKRIFNRVIFDDLLQQDEAVQKKGSLFQQELDVTWVPHPNWFYRISKFSLPFIQHRFVPETKFLNEIKTLPAGLENYVVKPLFSFAGQGVIIDVSKSDIEKITDPENWIIQKKVNYAAAIDTPDEGAKAEIRIFYFWPEDALRPFAANNLCRLSKGKMVGVRYNKDKTWVGGSFCLFEQ